VHNRKQHSVPVGLIFGLRLVFFVQFSYTLS